MAKQEKVKKIKDIETKKENKNESEKINMNKTNDLLNKIYICLIILIGIASINLINQFIPTNSTNNETPKQEQELPEYDTSSFNTLTAEKALEITKSKTPQVVYLGREGCSFCAQFIPTLKAMEEKYDYQTNYLPIDKVENDDDLKEFVSRLDMDYPEGEGQSYGDNYGVTPMVAIFKNGKMIDGSLGAVSEEVFEEFLNKNGIK